MKELTCAGCGMHKDAWRENYGQGYVEDGLTYCCRGCAEGSGCTCDQGQDEAQEEIA